MKKTLIAYLAGIMDADGYFTIRKQTYQIRIRKDSNNPTYSERIGIKQTCPTIVKLIHDYFGGYFRTEKPSAPNGKLLYALDIKNRKANEFLKIIYPYLVIKKKQADILFKLRASINEGKKYKHKTLQKDRWGKLKEFTKYSLSKEQVEFRESLINELNNLNDIRTCKFDRMIK